MLQVTEQDEKCRACCYLGYNTSNFSSVKEALLWGGLRLWLLLKEKKKKGTKSEDSQLHSYSEETAWSPGAAGREGLPGAEER